MFDLSACGSPLERRFGEAMFHVLGDAVEVRGPRSDNGIIGVMPGWKSIISTQTRFEQWRPDFMMMSLACGFLGDHWGEEAMKDAPHNTLVIEIDGHKYHERTKEQARRDRSRDRGMLAIDWIPMRFTGQEVHQDAEACALQAAEYFFERQQKVLDDVFMLHIERLAKAKRESQG